MITRERILFAQLCCLILIFTTFYSASAYIRFYGQNGFIYWGSNVVTYTINSAGSDDIPDKSEEAAIRLAFQAWSNVPEASIQFQEDPSGANSSDISGPSHLVLFDENNSTGLFTSNSGIVAITPITFEPSTGQILDADIVFNGRDHQFSVDGKAGTFDVQAIATHEIGHFLGLDHSAIRSATMFPFTQKNEYFPRSLSDDDKAGVANIYPAGQDPFPVNGEVRNKQGTGMRGAHVVAVDAATGKVLTSAVTDDKGFFKLTGLTVRGIFIYAEPLDGPVTKSEIHLPQVDSNFGTTFYGGNQNPQVISSSNAGTLTVDDAHSLNLMQISPQKANPGQIFTLYFMADGFNPSTMSLEFSNPGFQILGPITQANGWYKVLISVSSSINPGLYNVIIRDGSRISILTGGLEVLSPPPTIATVSPSQGSKAGGDSITLAGDGFQSGAQIMVGDQLATNVIFVNGQTLQFTTPANSAGGSVRVMVINPDGQFYNLDNGFTYVAGPPQVNSISPQEGSTTGGTQITITGSNFVSGITVTIGGKNANILSLSSSQLVCESPSSLTEGPQDVVLTNPGGYSLTIPGGFTYIPPSISSVEPAIGQVQGGTFIQIKGKGFDPKGPIEVRIGGKLCSNIQIKSENLLYATTPPGTLGKADLEALNTRDGKKATLLQGFEYTDTLDPKITSISPSSGFEIGGTQVTIQGSGFKSQATVLIGGHPATIQSLQPTTIVILTPKGSVGAHDVIVRNPNGQEVILLNGFTYIQYTPPAGGGGGGGGGCSLAMQPEPAWNSVGAVMPLLFLLFLLYLSNKRRRSFDLKIAS